MDLHFITFRWRRDHSRHLIIRLHALDLLPFIPIIFN